MNIGVQSFRRVSKASGTIAMRSFSDTFRRLLTIYGGKLTEMNLMNFMATKRESAPGPVGVPYSICRCAGGLGSQFFFHVFQRVLEGGAVPAHFAASRTVFIPPQLFRRRQQWSHRAIAGCTETADLV